MTLVPFSLNLVHLYPLFCNGSSTPDTKKATHIYFYKDTDTPNKIVMNVVTYPAGGPLTYFNSSGLLKFEKGFHILPSV